MNEFGERASLDELDEELDSPARYAARQAGRYRDRNAGDGLGLTRMFAKGEEARMGLHYVLNAIDAGVSIEALEAACKTVRAHIGD